MNFTGTCNYGIPATIYFNGVRGKVVRYFKNFPAGFPLGFAIISLRNSRHCSIIEKFVTSLVILYSDVDLPPYRLVHVLVSSSREKVQNFTQFSNNLRIRFLSHVTITYITLPAQLF